MLFASSFKSSISYTLARMVLVSSCLFGVAVSMVFLVFNFYKMEHTFRDIQTEIVDISRGSASYAAWTLDRQFADQVAGSVMSHPYVDYFELKDEIGNVLARRQSSSVPPSFLAGWIAHQFDHSELLVNETLNMPFEDDPRVGVLIVRLSANTAAQEIISSSLSIMLFGILQSFVIACVFLWISIKKITRPIRMYANFIDRIDPNNPASVRLGAKPYQRNNEIGRVIHKTNSLLDELSKAQQNLKHFACTDTLTLLPNRNAIVEALDDEIKNAKSNLHLVGVLFLDLDRFKNINDSLGHDFGDKLLIEVAQRLNDCLDRHSYIGRLGGDEFLIVLGGIRQKSEINAKLQLIENTFKKEYYVAGRLLNTGCSIGVSVFPEDGHDSSVLMRCADLAMYETKPSPHFWRFYCIEMTDMIDAKMKTESALHAALANNNFILYYQPKMTALTDKVIGCEALIRWKKGPEAISAADFIDIAEESGMIVELGYWVIEEACRQLSKWQIANVAVPIAINVSAKQLQELNFVKKSAAIFDKYHIDPSLIEYEITETVMMDNLDTIIGVLTQLRDLGIKISIDDFGTGYSSLAYLTRLPVDALKLDREFVSGAQQSKTVIKMILSMAQSLNLVTVAEGVETREQQEWLIDHRCDYLQGYFFSKPVCVEDFERLFLDNVPSNITYIHTAK